MENAASNVWEQVHDGLRAFIAKRVRHEAETDNLLQEVFLRVHRHVESLQEPDRMVSWVFQIARNAIIDITAQQSDDGNCQPVSRQRLKKKRPSLWIQMRLKPSMSSRVVFGQ